MPDVEGQAADGDGLAGLGDLVATCSSPLSRNRTFGERLGRGATLEELLAQKHQTAEGVKSCRSVLDLARKHDVDMPITEEVVGFQMPGAGMPGFARNSVTIAKAGIYDLRLHHDEVLSPVLRFWKVFSRDDLGPEGEQARDELAAFMAELDAQATRFVEKRDRQRASV